MNVITKHIMSVCSSALKPNIIRNSNKNIIRNTIRQSSIKIERLEAKPLRSMYKKKTSSKNEGSWVLLTIPVTAFALGTWQIKRKFWKDELIKSMENIMTIEPVDFPENLEELKKMEYHPVKVKGKFDHSKEIYMGPRTCVSRSKMNSSSPPGYWVITPFKLSDRDLTIMVNRGWVPKNKKSPATRIKGQILDEVEIVGVVRHSESRQPLGMKNIPERHQWMYRDLEKMAEYNGAMPILVDADVSSTVPEGPIGGQTVINLRNNHLSYIFTWYGLCAATSYLWYLKFIKM